MYVGLWYGGPGYSHGEWAIDAEMFDSIGHAARVLAERYRVGYVLGGVPLAAEWVDDADGNARPVPGEQGRNLICPAVAVGSHILLAKVGTGATLWELESDPYVTCTHMLEIGPHGGVRTVRL